MANEKTEKKESPFELFMKNYLDDRATRDPLFAKTYAKPNKSVSECCKYIIGEIRKKSATGMAVCCGLDKDLDSSDVIQLAIHYYDEDDIKVDKTPAAKVTVNVSASTTPPKPAEPEKPKERQLSIFDFL